ncbi:hypothetical protein MED222_06125 [Vibrio sp. MED222]|nr:hypothetical protein MED222_06125 [Vibrio sp. MED222]
MNSSSNKTLSFVSLPMRLNLELNPHWL